MIQGGAPGQNRKVSEQNFKKRLVSGRSIEQPTTVFELARTWQKPPLIWDMKDESV